MMSLMSLMTPQEVSGERESWIINFFETLGFPPEGKLSPLQKFDVIENNVFYDFANADHYCIGTLFGFQMNGDD